MIILAINTCHLNIIYLTSMPILATDYENIQKHLAVIKCAEVAEIMLPMLKKHGMTVFNYYRNYFDGSVIRLSTDHVWTMHYFKKNYLNTTTVPPAYLTKSLNYYIWLTDDCPEILLDAALNFNTSNGISIAKRHAEYIEYFCFATTLDNKSIVNNFYLNNLDVLLQYCSNFKDLAQPLLALYEKDRIVTANEGIRMLATSDVKIIDSSDPFRLSQQQRICARLLLTGLSCKQIAKEMRLSHRTVESYINNLRDKLDCRNKTELIVKLTDIF